MNRHYEVFIDGSSLGNPGPAGIGVVLFDAQRRPLQEISKPVGDTTCNVAEYLALIYALQEVGLRGWKPLRIKTDSQLMERQINGAYKVRNPALGRLHRIALNLMSNLGDCRLIHIPREENTWADELAVRASRKGYSQ